MATVIDALICYDIGSLQQVSVYDTTDYVLPDSPSKVNGIRMLFSTVNSVAQTDSATTDLIAWTEYEVTSGTAVINGISYATGDTLILANDTTYSGDALFETTGRYGQYISDQLPVANEAYSFSPTQCNIPAADSLYFSDNVVVLDLEHYTNVYTEGDSIAAGIYLCVGTQGESVLVNGAKTVYVGETYSSPGSEAFTGSPNLVLYEDEGQFTFSTLYQCFKVWESYLSAVSTTTQPDQVLDNNFCTVAALFATPQIAADTASNISTTEIQDSINRILEYYSLQL